MIYINIVKTLKTNAKSAKKLLKEILALFSKPREACLHGCDRALEYAIITDRAKITEAEKIKLWPIAGRVLG